MLERTIMTILVWGVILEVLSLIYLSSTPSRFEFTYSLFLLVITSMALVLIARRVRASVSKLNLPKNRQNHLPQGLT